MYSGTVIDVYTILINLYFGILHKHSQNKKQLQILYFFPTNRINQKLLSIININYVNTQVQHSPIDTLYQ